MNNSFRETKNIFDTESSDSDSESNFELLKKTLSKIMPNQTTTGAPAGQAQVTVDINLIKYYAEFIPEFNGNPLELRQYIAQVENTFLEIPEAAHKFVFAHARQKLKGAAKITCAGRTELNTWTALKERLIALYSCTDTLETLELKMNQAYPKQNETLLAFGSRLQHIRSQIIDKIHLTEVDNNRKILKIEFCETNAKNRFITFIPERYQTSIKLAKPIALEQAIDIYTGLEQEHEIRTAQRNLGQPQQKNTNHQNQNFRGYRNQQGHSSQNAQNQNFPNNSRNQNPNRQTPFPSQPINVQPRHVPQRYPQRIQAFNNPQRPNKNVFAPNRNFQPSPQVPMSGISSGSRQQNTPPNRQNYPIPMSGIDSNNIETNYNFDTQYDYQYDDQPCSENYSDNFSSQTQNSEDCYDQTEDYIEQDFQELSVEDPQT